MKFVGRVKVGGKKVTSDDIDRLAEKIIAELEKRELEKIKREEEVRGFPVYEECCNIYRIVLFMV